MQKWGIEYFTDQNGNTPVKAFIDGLPLKSKARTFKTLELLEEYGIQIGEPHVKHVERKLWELRIRCVEGTYRYLMTVVERRVIILLHAFQKKSQKLPLRELETARRRMRDVR